MRRSDINCSNSVAVLGSPISGNGYYSNEGCASILGGVLAVLLKVFSNLLVVNHNVT